MLMTFLIFVKKRLLRRRFRFNLELLESFSKYVFLIYFFNLFYDKFSYRDRFVR